MKGPMPTTLLSDVSYPPDIRMSDEETVRFSPADRAVTVPPGETLLDAALEEDISIEHLCGGNGLCGTCRVVVERGAEELGEPTEAETYLLSEDQLAAGYRLSCRTAVPGTGPVEVTVPPSSRETGEIILTEGSQLEVELAPSIKKYHLEVDRPSLSDNLADRERVLRGLAEGYEVRLEAIDHLVQRSLPERMRAAPDGDTLHVTATVYDDREIVDVEPGVETDMYGLAVDIGTTTLAAYLIDLQTGDTVAVSSLLNPQREHGEDIMTRMRYTRRHEGGRDTLQRAIVNGVNEAIAEVTASAGVERDSVYEAVFVGNTAMHHLFLGYDPDQVAGSPYIPANHAPVTLKARELGIDINPSGYLYWLPISGGWVGPDKVAVLLVSGHYDESPMTVCIDIGTNGEISVGNEEQTWTTSAPAGPALEGGELTDGVRAQRGAIDRVSFDGETFEPTVRTIDGAAPIGICGSGVIDALAGMFVTGIVDRRGQFTDRVRTHPRLRRGRDDVLEYVLVEAEASGTGAPIVVTQNDIRDIQMAKAAIQAGTRVLMDELGVTDIDRLVVSGAFGNYIDPESAMTIGLYPDVPESDVTSLGNGAGVGAQLALLDKSVRTEARSIIDAVEYFEIAGTDVFRDHFLQAMYLPHQVIELYPRVKRRLEAVRDLEEVEQPRSRR